VRSVESSGPPEIGSLRGGSFVSQCNGLLRQGWIACFTEPLVGGNHSVSGGRQRSSSGGQSTSPRLTGTFGGGRRFAGHASLSVDSIGDSG
jgi:hypothetical protein